MKTNSAIITLSVLLIVLAGCLSGGPTSGANTPETDTPTATPIDNSTITSDEVCVLGTPYEADPRRTMCLVDEKPPDLRINNYDNESHDVSIRIIKDDSTITYETNVTIEPVGSDGYTRRVLEDVINATGDYEIRATIDNTSSDAVNWTVSKRYRKTGSEQWKINLLQNGEIRVRRVASN